MRWPKPYAWLHSAGQKTPLWYAFRAEGIKIALK
jgi:hypothetical protein